MNDTRSGAAELRAAHSAMEPQQTPAPVDPGNILASLGFLAYDWDIASGALSFAGDPRKVLPGQWGHAFENVARLEESQICPVPGQRRQALFGEERLDDGSGVPYALSYRLRSEDGRLFLVEESGRWFAGLPGRPMSARGLLRVRSLTHEPELEARNGAELAAPPSNGGALHEVLTRAVELSRRSRRAFSLLALTARQARMQASDGCAGEDVAEGVAARLRRVMRRGDTLLRIDAETSLCVLNACDETQLTTAVKRLEAAFPMPGGLEPMSAVVGATWKGSHANAEALADQVVTQARAQLSSRRGASPTRRAMGAASPRKPIDWQEEILQALNERRLALALQPVVHAGSRRIAFHEGLLRLRSRSGRLLPASLFIPASEESGLVSLLDRRALELAAQELRRRPKLKLAINASAPSLSDPEWLETLRSHASSGGIFAGRLIVEITESMALVDLDRTIETLDAVKELDIAVAIDDFGAGHTSFRALRDLPVDIIKIDGAFVQDVDRSSDGRFFIRTLVDLARNLGCKVVGEWVESEAAARIVEKIGVDYLQGRLLGAPRLLAQPRRTRARERAPRRLVA
jgi:EAL domain-containing protein (putative c-di-GMP-specific phosphodiesterase class I)